MGGSRRLPRQPAAASRLHPLARPEGCVQAGRGAAVVCEGEAERVEEREDVPDGGAGGVEELLTAAARAAEELLRAAATTTAGPRRSTAAAATIGGPRRSGRRQWSGALKERTSIGAQRETTARASCSQFACHAVGPVTALLRSGCRGPGECQPPERVTTRVQEGSGGLRRAQEGSGGLRRAQEGSRKGLWEGSGEGLWGGVAS